MQILIVFQMQFLGHQKARPTPAANDTQLALSGRTDDPLKQKHLWFWLFHE